MKGGYFTSQTANKSEQELADPLGKYNIYITEIS